MGDGNEKKEKKDKKKRERLEKKNPQKTGVKRDGKEQERK